MCLIYRFFVFLLVILYIRSLNYYVLASKTKYNVLHIAGHIVLQNTFAAIELGI